MSAKSPEELLETAKAEGVEMTADEAGKYFVELHKTGELSDDELDNVSGGGCEREYHDACPTCGNGGYAYYGDSMVHCSNPECGQWYYHSKYKYLDE